jgi:hypothetical protein
MTNSGDAQVEVESGMIALCGRVSISWRRFAIVERFWTDGERG